MTIISELVVKLSADAASLTSGLSTANAQLVKSQVAFEKAGSSINGYSRNLAGGINSIVGSAIKVVAGVGIAAAGAGVAMTMSASKIEEYRTTLLTLYGDEKVVGEKLKWIFDFAKTTPFEVPQLINAFVRLKSYGIEGEAALKTLGDAASAMGKPLESAVEAVADAMTGEFERLKEFGIKAVVLNKDNYAQMGKDVDDIGKTVLSYVDKNGKQQFDIIDRNNKDMIQSTLFSIWNDKYAGGMEKQSKTFGGLVSNIKDSMTQAALAIMGFDVTVGSFKPGSLFVKMRDAAEDLMNYMGTMNFAPWGDKIASVVGRVANVMGQFWAKIQPAVQSMRQAMGDLGVIVVTFFKSFSSQGSAIDGVATIINKLAASIALVMRWLREHPEAVKAIVSITVGMMAWAALIGPVSKLVGGITGLGGAITAIGPAMKIAMAAFGGPIGIVIALLGTLFIAWRTNMFGIRDMTISIWSRIGPAIITPLQNAWDTIFVILVKLWDYLKVVGPKAFNILKNAVTIAWDTISKAFSKFWDFAGPILTRLWNFLKVEGEKALNILGRAFDTAKEKMSLFFSSFDKSAILKVAKDAIDRVSEAIGKLFKWFTDNPQIFGIIITIATAFNPWLRIVGILNSVWNALNKGPDTLNALSSSAQEIIPKITAKVSEIWSMVEPALTKLWNYLKVEGPIAIEFLWGIASKVFNDLKPIITDAIIIIWTLIKGFIRDVQIKWGQLMEMWAQVEPYLMPIMKGIAAVITVAWDTIIAVLQLAMRIIKDAVTGNWSDIWVAVKDFAAKITTDWGSFFTKMWEVAKEIGGKIWASIVKTWDDIKASIATALQGAWDEIVRIWNGIWNYLFGGSIIPDIYNAFVKWFGDIATAISDVWTAINNGVSSAWATITSTLYDVWTGIKNIASSIWGSIQSIFTSISIDTGNVRSAWDSVKDTLQSVWNGLKSAAQSAWDAIQKIWDKAHTGGGGGGGGDELGESTWIPVQGNSRVMYKDLIHPGMWLTGAGQSEHYNPEMREFEPHSLAQGGSFWTQGPTPLLVGEGGESEFVSVTPLSKMDGSGTGNTYNFIVQGNVYGVDDLKRHFENFMRDMNRNVKSMGG